ncbi:hypothetical protein JCM11491_005638 [Sporobolomyces phaffii]
MYFTPTLVSLLLTSVAVTEARNSRRCDAEDPAPVTAPSSTPSPEVPAGGHYIDFSTYDSSKQDVDAFLDQHGYMVSTSVVERDGDLPAALPRRHVRDNVEIVDGALRLKVTAYPDGPADEVESGEIESHDYYHYGTIEAWAKATDVPGVCQGIFFFESDYAEIDIELLSSYYTKGYEYSVEPGAQFTNQAVVAGTASTRNARAYGFDPAADFHNYTIQWTPTTTAFFIDGKHQDTFKKNVPKVASQIVFNNWANGDPNWSAGPPKEAAYFHIKSIKYTPYSA